MKNNIQLRVTTCRRFHVLENGDRPFISNRDFSQIFGISCSTARRWRRKYHIPHFRNGDRIQYYLQDVLDFIYTSPEGLNLKPLL